MLYRLTSETAVENPLQPGEGGRRFVLHRHRDAEGAHLDLRLEQDGYLMGFRVDGTALGPESWAALKAPHPLHWLAQDGEAVREDVGHYFWERGDASGGVLLLCGQRQSVRVTVAPVAGVPARVLGVLRAAAEQLGVAMGELAGLAEDGRAARERAIARYCGLGRELDGSSFDGGWWRAMLAGQRLSVIQQHLHGLELRFDRKYPPMPVSVPVALDDEGELAGTGGAERAMGILWG